MSVSPEKYLPLFRFLGGVFCIWFVIWVFVPFVLQQTQTEVMNMVQAKELDTGALFYTESQEAMEAGFLMIKDK